MVGADREVALLQRLQHIDELPESLQIASRYRFHHHDRTHRAAYRGDGIVVVPDGSN
jgi:hypothetical protein